MKRLLLLLPLLGGCTYYFDTGLDRQLSRRVEERLKNDEGLPLEQFSLTPPVSVEQALPKFKEGRPPSGRTLPPEKPVLSGVEGPVLSGAEEVVQSGTKVPDTPPVLKAQPEAGKPSSLKPVDTQKRDNPVQTESGLPSAKTAPVETEGPTLSGVEEAEGKLKSKVQPETSKQLSIAQARTLALENNLDLKIAQVDPKIAATVISQEEAKFDDLIFARVKYGSKNTPAQNLDVITLTPANPDLKGEVDKLTAVPQLTEILEMEAGVVIPLRTGDKITVSAPFDEKNYFRVIPSDQYLSALRFSISQPLLRGGGIDNNVAGIRIAQYEQQAVDVKTRLQASGCWPPSNAPIGGCMSRGASWMCAFSNTRTRPITWPW